jgi:hypothetical protein
VDAGLPAKRTQQRTARWKGRDQLEHLRRRWDVHPQIFPLHCL